MISLLRRFVSGLRALARREQADRELDDELRGYLEAAVEHKMSGGIGPDDALREARAEVGSIAAVKDATRAIGWEAWLDSGWQDLRHAGRGLKASPAFTAVAATTLALGIGANTAIFSVVNAVLLRPLPVQRPAELISLAVLQDGNVDPVFSYAAYRQFAVEGAKVVDVFAASAVNRVAITLSDEPEPIDQKWVSGNYFTTLGVPAAIGRTVLPTDEGTPPGEPVAVLSDAFWARRFGRDPAVVGRTFVFRGSPYTVVGVAPRGFFGETVGEAPDVWMALTAQPGSPAFLWSGHSTSWLRLLARRRPGVALERARAGLEPVYAQVRKEMAAEMRRPEFRAGVLQSRLIVTDAAGGASRLRDPLSAPLIVLMASVGLVLVIACANVANLLLARGTARRRETAVCLALGAGRLRLVQRRLAEALLLAACGGGAGLLLALWGGPALVALVSRTLPVSLDVSPDVRVLAFTMLVSCATACAFGLAPALRAARVDPLPALKETGQAQRAARLPLGRTLVAAQVAVSLVLLVAAGLLVRSLINLREIDTGFDPARVLLLEVTAPIGAAAMSPEERRVLYRQMLTRAEAVPGVRAASLSTHGLLTSGTWGNAITVEGFVPAGEATPRTLANAISARYFEVMGIAVLRGRGFTDADDEAAPRAAVVNQAFAARFFGAADPVGRRVGLGAPAAGMMEIVGVVEDVKYVDLREPKRPMLYVPFTQYEQILREVEVRTTGDPAAAAAALRRELSAVDRRVAVVGTMQLRDRVDASMVSERLMAIVSAVLGLLALMLATLGLYAVVSYVAAQRTAELGIRMALGADRGDVGWLVLRDTLRIVLAGAAIGIPAALGAATLLRRLLYEVGPADPAALAGATVTLLTAALVAGYLPARRAARVDPMVALRYE